MGKQEHLMEIKISGLLVPLITLLQGSGSVTTITGNPNYLVEMQLICGRNL